MLSLLLALGQEPDTWTELSKLAGDTWACAIMMPDHTEHVLSRYVLNGDTISVTGEARPLLGKPTAVKTKFTRLKDGSVRMEDQQGETRLAGTVHLEDGKLVFTYGIAGAYEAMVRDVITRVEDGRFNGEVGAEGKQIATYVLRKVKAGEPKLVLGGFDPVALSSGVETAGLESVSRSHGQWRYQFSSTANRETFLRDPDRYAVQFGGACMNMGPLSGRGQSCNYSVFDKRVYLFASGSCRQAFLRDPAAYVDAADTPFTREPGDATEAQARLHKMAKAHGMTKALKNLAWTVGTEYTERGVKKTSWQGWVVDNLGRAAQVDAWDHQLYKTLASPKGGYTGSIVEPVPLSQQEGDYLTRLVTRHPVWLLANRSSKGFLAQPVDAGVRVHWNGVTVILSSDPETGRLARASYRGRTAGGIVAVTDTFQEYKQVEGVWVPMQWTSRWGTEGKSTTKLHDVFMNLELGDGFFRHPLK